MWTTWALARVTAALPTADETVLSGQLAPDGRPLADVRGHHLNSSEHERIDLLLPYPHQAWFTQQFVRESRTDADGHDTLEGLDTYSRTFEVSAERYGTPFIVWEMQEGGATFDVALTVEAIVSGHVHAADRAMPVTRSNRAVRIFLTR